MKPPDGLFISVAFSDGEPVSVWPGNTAMVAPVTTTGGEA
jgi:hypothetical protein